jgi:hypothetical protein
MPLKSAGVVARYGTVAHAEVQRHKSNKNRSFNTFGMTRIITKGVRGSTPHSFNINERRTVSTQPRPFYKRLSGVTGRK